MIVFGWRAAMFLPMLLSVSLPERALAQQESATVMVHVADEREDPLFGADVRLYSFGHGNPTHRGFTSAGMVEFSAVMRGSYILEVRKEGYETHSENIDVNPGGAQSFSVNLHVIPGETTAPGRGGTVSAAALNIPAAARKEFESGVAALAKDPSSSIADLQKAIKDYPKYSEAYAWLGIAYMQEKRNGDARDAVEKAISLDPKLSLAHTVLGKLYFEERKFSQAEAELLQSIQLDPQSWEARFELARCYFNTGKLDKALEHAQRAHDIPQASPRTHLLLVDIYLRKGDKANALRELQEFAKADPQSPLMPRVKQKIEQLSKPN